jgi:hypothetical protein
MKTALMTVGFFVGMMSCVLLCLYIIGMVSYGFGGDMTAMAYAPKWVFLFTPMVLFGRTKRVQNVIF